MRRILLALTLLMAAWSLSGCALVVGEMIRYDWCGHIFTPCSS